MFLSVWFLAIGLLFGWCAMLLSVDSSVPRWGRALIAVLSGAIAGFLFDYVAFEGDHMVWSLGGSLCGAALAITAHDLLARGLERRGTRKEPKDL